MKRKSAALLALMGAMIVGAPASPSQAQAQAQAQDAGPACPGTNAADNMPDTKRRLKLKPVSPQTLMAPATQDLIVELNHINPDDIRAKRTAQNLDIIHVPTNEVLGRIAMWYSLGGGRAQFTKTGDVLWLCQLKPYVPSATGRRGGSGYNGGGNKAMRCPTKPASSVTGGSKIIINGAGKGNMTINGGGFSVVIKNLTPENLDLARNGNDLELINKSNGHVMATMVSYYNHGQGRVVLEDSNKAFWLCDLAP